MKDEKGIFLNGWAQKMMPLGILFDGRSVG
jgi:hypothetical protein